LFRGLPVSLLVCVCGGLLWADTSPVPTNSANQVRVLIVTGEDYQGHKWQETTAALKTQLEKDSPLVVEVLDDLKQLGEFSLSDYDVVVMHFKNYDAEVPGREGFDNLARFVHEGGGLVLVHFACGAFQEFRDDFVKLAGRAWNPELRGHDPYGSFQVEIANANHPITRGMKPFETTDELYTCLDGDQPIEILATARSKVDDKVYPIAFVLPYGKGRVFHCVLGHSVEGFQTPKVGALFRRGCQWTAGRLE
jgi:type 1 glutamine amidotransferase